MRVLRGHAAAVGSATFSRAVNPFAHIIASRLPLNTHAFINLYLCTHISHTHSQGDRIASVDAAGVVVLWDVRTLAPVWTTTTDAPATRCVIDPSGSVLAVGGADGCVRMLEVADGSVVNTVRLLCESFSLGSGIG